MNTTPTAAAAQTLRSSMNKIFVGGQQQQAKEEPTSIKDFSKNFYN
jgi:hypothetical protein